MDLVTGPEIEAVIWQMQNTLLLTMTPRRLGRRACANNCVFTEAYEKRPWLDFWIGTERHLEMEDSDHPEVDDGRQEV